MTNAAVRSPWSREYERTPNTYIWGTAASPLAREVAALVPPGGHVLDLGCGEGRDSVFLAALGFEVTAVDVSHAGISKGARLAHDRGVPVRWIQADIGRLVVHGPLDLVYSCGSIHYVPRRRRTALLMRLAASTADGGLHAHIVFTDCLIYREKGETVDYFAPGELRDAYAGWSILRTTETVIPCTADGTFHQHSVEEIVARKP
jgi:tellurite methyltransferase